MLTTDWLLAAVAAALPASRVAALRTPQAAVAGTHQIRVGSRALYLRHLQVPQVQSPTPNPDSMSSQQQQLEEFSALQHEMQAEQQQQQPGANQLSANCHAADAALEEPSQLEQQNDSGSED